MRGGGGGGVDRPVRALHHNHRGAELGDLDQAERGTFNFSNFPLEHSLQSSGAQRRKVVQHPTWAREPCQKTCNFKLAELSCYLSETNKSLQKPNTILPAYCRSPPSSVPPPATPYLCCDAIKVPSSVKLSTKFRLSNCAVGTLVTKIFADQTAKC